MDQAELDKVLDSHSQWLRSQEGGQKANLCGANLCDANLRGANLCDANLRGANLHNADLCGANLRNADLCGANLCGANLCNADLRGANLCDANLCGANLGGANLWDANLCGANLCDANLRGANLCGADLRGANLCGANLWDANLCDANLRETVLDPGCEPNREASEFQSRNGRLVGYRTRKAGHIDNYRDGRYYSADWFSTCEETECHPGLYLWPTLEEAIEFSGSVPMIEVETEASEVHKVGSKYRCRWFYVVGEAKA